MISSTGTSVKIGDPLPATPTRVNLGQVHHDIGGSYAARIQRQHNGIDAVKPAVFLRRKSPDQTTRAVAGRVNLDATIERGHRFRRRAVRGNTRARPGRIAGLIPEDNGSAPSSARVPARPWSTRFANRAVSEITNQFGVLNVLI